MRKIYVLILGMNVLVVVMAYSLFKILTSQMRNIGEFLFNIPSDIKICGYIINKFLYPGH